VALVAAVCALGLAGCGGSASPAAPAPAVTASPTVVNGVQVFNVVGTASLEFSPRELIASPGKIKINLTVETGSPLHNFVIASIPAARTGFASVGEPATVTFTVDKPGSYPFACTIHPNMQGTLTIR
jgi:plastocyanin